MTKKKAKLPGVEILIILVLFVSLILFAVMRCNETKESLQPPEDTTSSTTITDTATTTTLATTTYQPPKVVGRLYVTLDELNLRTGPSLDSTILLKLPLFEEVIFMEEVTDFTEEINLGPETANEPWVKIKSKKGHIGWVYGAGVHYYKKRRLPKPDTTNQ